MTATSSDPALGTVVDERYELLELLGRGGYGLVFKARQLNTGQLVAVKVLLVEKAGSSRHATEVARFQREMKLIGQLRHPNVVRLIDSGELVDGRLYLVLEYIEGETLAAVIKRGPVPIRQAVRLLRQVLEALARAHQTGVIHRDLKPHNIMVTDPGPRCNAMVVDFGVSFIAEEARDADYKTLTARDEVAGTPGYMAPEQLILGTVSPAVDLYAWGLVAVEMLSGQPAVTETSLVKLILRYSASSAIDIPECLLDSPFGALLERATAVDPEERYASAEDALVDLEAISLSDAEIEALEAALAAQAPSATGAAPAPRREPDGSAAVGWDSTIDSMPTRLGDAPSPGDAGATPPPAAASPGLGEAPSPQDRVRVRTTPPPTLAPDTPDSRVTRRHRQRPEATLDPPVTPAGATPALTGKPRNVERTLLLGAALVIAGLLAVLVVDRVMPSEPAANGKVAVAAPGPIAPSASDPGSAATPSDAISTSPDVAPGEATAPSSPELAWMVSPGATPRGMASVPAGSFVMGCNPDVDTDCWADELPAHVVELDAFEIDFTEVTVGAYAACVEAGVCQPPVAFEPGRYPNCNWGLPDRVDHPVNCLSWFQAQLFCEWRGHRLPTEAEWERAARGQDGRLYPWGERAPDCQLAVLTTGAPECTHDHTVEVGSRPAGASPYGVLDLAGSVSEWVADWYDRGYYEHSAPRNPTGPLEGQERGERGGDFNDEPQEQRVTRRAGSRPWDIDDDLGFRCARSVREGDRAEPP